MNETTTGERVTVDAAAVADLQRMLNSWWANVGHDLGGPQTAELYAALRTIADTARPLPSREAFAAALDYLLFEWHNVGLNGGSVNVFDPARVRLLALIYGDDAPGGDAS